MDDDTPQSQATLDDEELGALVRGVADGWRMPPQRLGQRTWRDRATDAEGRRGSRRGGWRRVARPLAAALVATVVLAVGVIWIDQLSTRPAIGSGSPSPAPSDGVGGSATPAAGPPTPAPALYLSTGPLPADELVVLGSGAQVVDLTSGGIGPVLDPTGRGWSLIWVAGGPTVTCLCVIPTYDSSGGIGGATASLVRYTAPGPAPTSTALTTYGPAVEDPAVSGWGTSVGIELSRGSGDRAYVGWTVRLAASWASGVDVVDLRAGRVVQTVTLPTFAVLADGSDGTTVPTFALAPVVTESPDATAVVIGQSRGIVRPDAAVGVVHWSAPMTDGHVGDLTSFATGQEGLEGDVCDPVDETFVDATTYSALCRTTGKDVRVDLTGRPVGDVPVPGLSASSFVSSVTASDGTRFIWMPYTHQLVRIDPDGAVRAAAVEPAAASGGPAHGLAALGRDLARWIAPAADAKLYLQPAMALSPDGSRLYLLGSRSSDPYSTAGSTGIAVIETSDLSVVDRWEPTADFVSIGVGRDGTLVYALGAPGIRQLPDGTIEVSDSVPASLTVFDAGTGQERAFAGQLGADYLRLDPALMP